MQRTVACLALFLVACGDVLPPEEKVVEHRILSAAVVVTEPLDPAEEPEGFERAEAMPGEEVEVRPFFVSPTGVVDPADTDPRWIACELFPGGGPFSCISDAFPTSLTELPDCEFPGLEELAASGAPPKVETPCLLGSDPSPRFTVPASEGVLSGADIELTMIGSTPGGTPTGTCAAQLLRGVTNLPNDCLYGVQVASVGPKLQLLSWLASLGVDLGGLPPPASEDIDAPDLHPRITSFAVSVVDDTGAELQAPVEVERGGEFEVEQGQILRIDTHAPEEDLQDFHLIVNQGAEGEPVTEAYRGVWLITWGSLLSGQSLDPQSYNEWTLDPADNDADTPPDGTAHLYYVLRDGRRGVTPWWITLRFR